jgi:uncharacterized membrane protein
LDDVSPPPAVPPTRLVALADGVFAIVMTLLVFGLGIPTVSGNGALGDALVEMWPEFAVYALSFLVLGVFWLVHHVLFDIIERYDTTLVWLNIVFLMFAALIPFSTGLFAEHGTTTATAVVYGVNAITVFGAGWAIFSYATAGRRLVDADLDPDIVRGGKRMGLAYMLFLALSVAVSIISPATSFVLYGILVAAFIAMTMLGRSEVVMVWRRTAGSRRGSVPRRDSVVSP